MTLYDEQWVIPVAPSWALCSTELTMQIWNACHLFYFGLFCNGYETFLWNLVKIDAVV